MIDMNRDYPFVLYEIILFFGTWDHKQGHIAPKSVHDFCEYYKSLYNCESYPQPAVISKLCEKLAELSHLSVLHRSGMDGSGNKYLCVLKDRELLIKNKERMNHEFSCQVFGFPYIYSSMKDDILPLIFKSQKNDIEIGSCFKYSGGIVTAKHCLEKASSIAIVGLDKELFKGCRIYISKNPMMDIAYIELNRPLSTKIICSGEAQVLDNIITLGYPKVPGYQAFLTAEKATVASRFSTTHGSVAAISSGIWIKEKLILITAKIRGGNSGGPIIRDDGCIVGVSVNAMSAEGNYDDIGYGAAIPIQFVNEVISKKEKTLEEKVVFETYEEQANHR